MLMQMQRVQSVLTMHQLLRARLNRTVLRVIITTIIISNQIKPVWRILSTGLSVMPMISSISSRIVKINRSNFVFDPILRKIWPIVGRLRRTIRKNSCSKGKSNWYKRPKEQMRVGYQNINKTKQTRTYEDQAKRILETDWLRRDRQENKYNDKNNGKDRKKSKENKDKKSSNDFKNKKTK